MMNIILCSIILKMLLSLYTYSSIFASYLQNLLNSLALSWKESFLHLTHFIFQIYKA